MATSPPQRIEPPVRASELAEATEQTPQAMVEDAQLSAVSAQAVEATASATWREVTPWVRQLGKWLLALVALYVAGWLLWNAAPALTPFVIGLVLAYLLMPTVDRLDERMPRWLAILLVYIGGIGLVAIAIAFIIPPAVDQVQQLIGSIPDTDRLLAMWNALVQEYRALVPASFQQPIEQGLRNALQTAQANLAGYLQGVGTFLLTQVLNILNTLTFLIGFLIIPIWLFYVLNDRSQARSLIDRLLPTRARPDFWNIWSIIDEIFSDYVRGQLLLGLAVGVMVGIGLLILRLLGFDVRYILLLAIIAGITELIPIIGPIIGAIPGVLVGFFGGENGVQAGLAVLVLYIVVQQLENNLLVPRIIGESVGVHPAILTVILIAMGQVFGLLGVVLAAPLTAIARDLFVYIYRRLDGLSAAAARESIIAEAPAKEAATTPG
ncbi:MAG TPA: AI-2E family transporter [Roseiflexaceae bacterium]|nr:AI-2E family transporter [Roseiflexaceae bacterium]